MLFNISRTEQSFEEQASLIDNSRGPIRRFIKKYIYIRTAGQRASVQFRAYVQRIVLL